MAGEIASAFVRVRPNTAGFKPELERGVKGAFAGVGRLAAQVGVAYGGFKLFESAIKSAAEQEQALGSLEQSVKSVGAAWMVNGQSLKQVLNEMSVASGSQLPDLAQGFARIVTQTRNSEEALKDLHRAQDISIARHVQLSQAATILARAEGGSDLALRRLGITLPKLHPHYDALARRITAAQLAGAKFSASERLVLKAHLDAAKALDARGAKTRVLAAIDERFSGQTARYAKTAAGEWARFHVSVGNVLSDIGTGMLPGLSHAAAGLQGFIEHARKSGEYADLLSGSAKSVGEFLHGVGVVAREVGPPLMIAVKGAAALLHAIGGPAIVTGLITYKAIGLALGVSARAQMLFAGATAKSVAAQETETGSASALTAALEANTAALRVNTGALEGETVAADAAAGSMAAAGTSAERAAAKSIGAVGRMRAAFKSPIAIAIGITLGTAIARADSGPLGWIRKHVTDPIGHQIGNSMYDALNAVSPRVTRAIGDVLTYSAKRAKPKAADAGKQVGDDFSKSAFDQVEANRANFAAEQALAGPETRRKARDAGQKVGSDVAAGIAQGVTEAEARAIYRRAVSRVTGDELGYPMIQGLVDAIRTRSPELANQLGTSVADAMTSARLSIRDAFESAAGNLDTLGADVASRIGSVLDQRLTVQIRRIETGLDMRIRRMQDKLSALQAVRERRSLREDITAAGVNAAGLRRNVGESVRDFEQRRVDAAKQITSANVALETFETGQTISALQKRSERTKEHLQRRNELAKEASARNIADLTDSFNRGAITQEQLVHGIAAQMRKQGAGYREAGRVLGSAFAHGFSAEVTALAKQATIIGKLPRLPGVTGVEPQLVRPIDAVRAAIISVAQAQAQRDQSALEEQKKQTAYLKKVHAAQLKAAGRTKAKDFVDDLTTGSKR